MVAAPKPNGDTSNTTIAAPAFLLQHEDEETAAPADAVAFSELRGKWIGIALASTLADTAKITLFAGKTGSLTGQLFLSNGVIPLNGRVSRDGTVAIKIPRKGTAPLRIQLALDPVTHEMRGALHSDALIVEFTGHHALFTTAKNPHLPRLNLPSGWSGQRITTLATSVGRAALRTNVAADGSVRISGQLPGGKAPFTAGSLLSNEGRLPVFARVPGTKDILSGWLQFFPSGEIPAEVIWFHGTAVETLGTPGAE
jgi:hypothetical protein